MDEIEKTIDAIKQEEDLTTSLNSLGTYLRNEQIRSHSGVFQLIPKLLRIYQDLVSKELSSTDQAIILEVLRVLVNITADNDKNRLELIQFNDFWLTIRTNLAQNGVGIDRILILMSQFTKNTNELQTFSKYFYQLRIHEPLFYLLEKESELSVLILEVLGELLIPELVVTDDSFKLHVSQYLSLLITLYDQLAEKYDSDELPDMYYYISAIMYNITQYNDLDTTEITRIYSLFDKFTTNLQINRQLFSTIGNLSLMQNFNDIDLVKFILENGLIDKTQNLYLKSSYYLTIGNFITSESKHREILNLIDDQELFIKQYFDNTFTDVIQFQSIHLIKNLMNKDLVPLIIGHSNLINFCKILSDNQNYYKEIYQTFMKFWNKLIPLSFPVLSIYDYSQYWELLDNEDIYIKLAPFMSPTTTGDNSKQLNSKIIRHLFLTELPLESHKLLEKIKFQAILLQNNHEIVYDTILRDEFDPKLLIQLEKLLKLLTDSAKDNYDYKVLLNNSKFVSISLMKLESPEVTHISNSILNLPDV